MQCSIPLRLSTLGAATDSGRREYGVTFIQAGYVRRRDGGESNWRIPPETLQAAVGKLDGVACFVDHCDWFEIPSVRDLAGVTFQPFYEVETESIRGGLRLYDRPDLDWLRALLDQVVEDQAEGREVPDIGLSLSFFGRHDWVENGARGSSGERLGERVTTEITHVESCDLVFGPGANGRVREILSGLGARGLGLSDQRPASGDQQPTQKGVIPRKEVLQTMEEVVQGQGQEQEQVVPVVAPPARDNASLSPQEAALASQVQSLTQQVERLTQLMAGMVEPQAVRGMGVAPRAPQVTLGRTSLEQVNAALEALVAGVSPPAGVAPLTGIRELYHLLSGDYNMTGLFNPEHVYLANVNASTMAVLTANVLNKVVANMFQQYPRWWEPIVTVQNFTSLQDACWVTLGGVGELPTVAEGAAYTELTWDDKSQTDPFVKKGGYLGITLEAIDKDDTGRLRAAPQALAQAAWLTLSKSISGLFTDNSGVGPTLDDTGALFNSTATSTAGGHANLGSTALSWASWRDTRILMAKQTELNSGERLGGLTAGYYCVVPLDLEVTAMQALGSADEPGTADNDVNPFAEGETREARLSSARKRVVVCPLWTDTNNWAAVADPRLYPTIGVGYRYGDTPEIFSVASPTAGLMFTNDTMPIKVRFFYVVSAIDWRGLYKHNVS